MTKRKKAAKKPFPLRSKLKRSATLELVDTNVLSPVALAASSQSAFLIYQAADGVVYVSQATPNSPFQPKAVQLSGEGSSGSGFGLAMWATGPAIAFDPNSNRVIAAYQKADGSAIIVASIDPNFATPWQLDGTIPTPAPLLGGLSLVAGTAGGDIPLQGLFCAVNVGEGHSKFVYSIYQTQWSTPLTSVQVQFEALNPVTSVGPIASIDPDTNAVTIGWSTSQGNDSISTAPDFLDFEAPFDFSTLNGASSTFPPCTLSGFGAMTAWINQNGMMLYTFAVTPGQWQAPVIFPPFSDGMNGSPAAATYLGTTTYIARVDNSGNLQYCTISSG